MISRYETGRRSPRLDTLQRLAEVVDLEVVVSFRPASPRHAIEPSDPGTSKVVLPDSMSTSDGETGRQDGDAIFTMRADVTAYREG